MSLYRKITEQTDHDLTARMILWSTYLQIGQFCLTKNVSASARQENSFILNSLKIGWTCKWAYNERILQFLQSRSDDCTIYNNHCIVYTVQNWKPNLDKTESRHCNRRWKCWLWVWRNFFMQYHFNKNWNHWNVFHHFDYKINESV